MNPWVITTIIIMVLLAIAFALFVAEGDRQRLKSMQRLRMRSIDRRSRPE